MGGPPAPNPLDILVARAATFGRGPKASGDPDFYWTTPESRRPPGWPGRAPGLPLACFFEKGRHGRDEGYRGFWLGAMALASREKPRAGPEALDAIDIVGTGGDVSGSLNLSTVRAALIWRPLAALPPVVKPHGKSPISSRSGPGGGSRDFGELFGLIEGGSILRCPWDETQAARCFSAQPDHVFVFCRPYFHPADETALAADPRALIGAIYVRIPFAGVR